MKKKTFAKRITQIDTSVVDNLLKFIANENMISFAGGLPDPNMFPVEDIKQASVMALDKYASQALQYCPTGGIPSLKEKIAKRLERINKIHINSLDEMLLTNGSQQALDLMAKTFINPGDVVLVEAPTYMAAINAFRVYECEIIGLKMDEEGICPDDLKEKLETYKNVKFIYTIPDFQNPTGRTMSLERRKQILDIVKDYDTLIAEDNPYGELRYEGEMLPSLKALDTIGQVVYFGTLSKIVSPGMRLGWIVADTDTIAAMTSGKQCADMQSNTLCQYIADQYFENFDVDKHVEHIKEVYGNRQKYTLKLLEEYMPEGVSFTRPQGGLFLWITFPEDIDAAELLCICIKHGVAYVPGFAFYTNGEGHNQCRINFSYNSGDMLHIGVKALADAIEEYKRLNS